MESLVSSPYEICPPTHTFSNPRLFLNVFNLRVSDAFPVGLKHLKKIINFWRRNN